MTLDKLASDDGRWDYTYDSENRLVQLDTAAVSRGLFGVGWQWLKWYDPE